MDKVNNSIECCKRIYDNSGASSEKALMLVKRYYVSALLLKNKNLIHTAYHTLQSVTARNPSSLSLSLMLIFLNIELGLYEKADEQIDELNLYKNYFKANEPVKYGIFLYLQSLNEYRTLKTKTAVKFFKALKDLNGESPDDTFLMLLGMLKMEFQELGEAGLYLKAAYKKGVRSPFLFLTLYRYFSTLNKNIEYTDELLIPFLNWGLLHDLDLSEIVEAYSDKIVLNFLDNSEIGIKLYRLYPNETLLREICKIFINDYDYSERAYYFYIEAMTKQIEIIGLNDYIIKSSFKNKKEKLSVYTLRQFLRTGEISVSMKPYLYHMLLSSKKYADLAEEYHAGIVSFGVYCLESYKTGAYYNSLYKYILDNEGSLGIAEKYIEIAEGRLFEELLSYEIEVTEPLVKYIFISEKEKSGMARYEVSDCKAVVKAVSDSFQYYCFSGDERKVISCDATVIKRIKNEDLNLYMRYYNKNYRSEELLIALSKAYMRLEAPPGECVLILTKTAENPNLSKDFKMKIIAAIGNIFYNENKPEKAAAYYKKVDLRYLSDRNVDHMAQVLTEEREYEKVVHILLNRPECLFDKTMFYIVKQLAKDKEYHELIADFSYELLLKSWYDRQLIDIVLSHYKGSQEEWQQMYAVLSSIGIKEKKLDELIIQNGIWMHKFDAGLQEAFRSVYEEDKENPYIMEFVRYAMYEVIVNKSRLQRETLSVLEKIFRDTNDTELSYMLSHVYIEQGLSTAYSPEIIKYAAGAMEEEGILFAVFKDAKDKNYSTPYIEKNQPFIYKSTPGKNVVLHFRGDDEKEYMSKKMKYVMFGFYMTVLPHFYNEELNYYISEEMASGSIETRKNQVYNNSIYLYEETDDPYFAINNAIIYDKIFKYDKVEQIITERIRESRDIRGTVI